MTIKPALEPGERHKIEKALSSLGYNVSGGGQMADGVKCSISVRDNRQVGRAVRV